MQGRYVASVKPNPAVLSAPTWHPDIAEKELRDVLDKTKGCNVEIILKDISTVCYKPERLWQWTDIACEVVNDYE